MSTSLRLSSAESVLTARDRPLPEAAALTLDGGSHEGQALRQAAWLSVCTLPFCERTWLIASATSSAALSRKRRALGRVSTRGLQASWRGKASRTGPATSHRLLFHASPHSSLPQSMMTPSRMVLPWQAVEVTTRACEMGKPVLVRVYSRKTKGSVVRGSMKTKLRVSCGSKVPL